MPYTLPYRIFLIGIIHLTFLALSIIIFRDIKMRTYRAWPNCTYVHAGLALYWWQRLPVITFGVGRIRVKISQYVFYQDIIKRFFKIVMNNQCAWAHVNTFVMLNNMIIRESVISKLLHLTFIKEFHKLYDNFNDII